MWKEKLGNYLIDVSKYFLTGVFVASLIKDLESVRWLIYTLSGTVALVLLLLGLILTNKKENPKTNSYGNTYNTRNGGNTRNAGSRVVRDTQRKKMAARKQHDLEDNK